MGYQNADRVLPSELIKMIQKYVDGDYIYIPRKANERKQWGECTAIREELKERNASIYLDYQKGMSMEMLADKYFLSLKSIQRIIYTSD